MFFSLKAKFFFLLSCITPAVSFSVMFETINIRNVKQTENIALSLQVLHCNIKLWRKYRNKNKRNKTNYTIFSNINLQTGGNHCSN